MFHINYQDYNISYSFRHTRDVNFVIRKDKVITDVTECDLLVNGKEFSDISACSAGDIFIKDYGRKVSLRRALEKAELPKDVRAEVWKDYHRRMGSLKDELGSAELNQSSKLSKPILTVTEMEWNLPTAAPSVPSEIPKESLQNSSDFYKDVHAEENYHGV